MGIDKVKDFFSEISDKIYRFRALIQDEIIPEIDIRMAEILNILNVMPERIFDLRDYIQTEIIPVIEIFWVELNEFLRELPGAILEFQRYLRHKIKPYIDNIIRATRIFLLEIQSRIANLPEISPSEIKEIGGFIHKSVREFVLSLPSSVLHIKRSIFEMIEGYGTEKNLLQPPKLLNSWLEDNKNVFRALFIRTKQSIIEIPAFFYRLRDFLYLGASQSQKLLIEDLGLKSDSSWSLPKVDLSSISDKSGSTTEKLNEILQQALELDEVSVLRVFRGFLVFCRVKDQRFILWVHEQSISGLLSQTKVVDTALLGSLLLASRIVPGGPIAARFAAQKIFKLPAETKNRVFVPSLHIVETGKFSVVREETVDKISSSIKSIPR
ncbi:MAG: hypothetical protein ACFFBD_09930, partial [Candidatus Hodarchaeota archaeon]